MHLCRSSVCDSLTVNTRVPSPLVPVPGVGQVGQGLQNTWGLEEDEEEEEEEEEGGEEQEESETMEVEKHEKDSRGGYFEFSEQRTIQKPGFTFKTYFHNCLISRRFG